MVMRVVEGLFLIGFVGLILSDPKGFSAVVTGGATAYSTLVRGLQGPIRAGGTA